VLYDQAMTADPFDRLFAVLWHCHKGRFASPIRSTVRVTEPWYQQQQDGLRRNAQKT
jgi:hypothetical protein